MKGALAAEPETPTKEVLMALLETPATELGALAPDFALKDAAGHTVMRDEAAGPNGLVVGFICNHCPYVKAIADQLGKDIAALKEAGIGVALIMSNDWESFPDDAPERMGAFAKAHNLDAPYLVDETQEVARAYGAVCTPDFFGYDRAMKLVYRGRLDAITPSRAPQATDRRELVEAMTAVARGEEPPKEQRASMGCSIKWRE
jgi:peroxiredoxin